MQNYHLIEVKTLPWTNKKPSRIAVSSCRFKQRLLLSSHESNLHRDDYAVQKLKDKGFVFIGQAEGKNNTTILISSTFKPLK